MRILIYGLEIYTWIVLAAVILSWLPRLRDNPIGHAIAAATDPVLAPLRKVVPPLGGIDWSPLVVLLGLRLLIRVLR